MIRLEVKKNEFEKIASELPVKAAAVVHETALEVSARTKASTPVRTGKLQRGWYVRHEGAFRSRIANQTRYWPFVEFGTHKMPAHPMVTPAVEGLRASFIARLRGIFR